MSDKRVFSFWSCVVSVGLGDDDVVNWNVYQLDEEPNEPHHAEPDSSGNHGSRKLCAV